MRVALPTVLLTAATLALAAAAPAVAETSNSSNWAGYVVHRSGVLFTKVAAAWKQPSASCAAGKRSYSALWVGLGGYSQSSNALEQVGTEVDCTASGRVASSAWFELLPAASAPIPMRVRPGDSVAARVTVAGRRVLIALYDRSTHQGFQKTELASLVDASSAEWILEAPSACISETSCQTLPLANFHSATFALAGAESTTGHVGTISDPAWSRTKIRLTPLGRRFVVYHGSGPAAGMAAPSGLSASGGSFKLAFSEASVPASPFLAAQRSAPQAGYLEHPRP